MNANIGQIWKYNFSNGGNVILLILGIEGANSTVNVNKAYHCLVLNHYDLIQIGTEVVRPFTNFNSTGWTKIS